ncbi:MAG: hypothetical protein KJO98_02315, partial [Rhodothermia bacterium]|nr:hypothetical protein [Rhodothermia bacterium]
MTFIAISHRATAFSFRLATRLTAACPKSIFEDQNLILAPQLTDHEVEETGGSARGAWQGNKSEV